MMKTHVAATALLLGLAAPLGAVAEQITLGNSTSGSDDFTGHPPNIGVTSSGLTGHAFYRSDTGTYTFGSADFTAGPLSGGNYPASGTQHLTVTFTDGDTAAGDVTWSLLKDHSFAPDFIGTWAIATSAGDADFLTDFAAGSIADIDLVVVVRQAIDTLFDGLSEVIQFASSGQIVPGSTSVPEPTSTLALVGVALGMLGLWRRQQRSSK
jgi:hypothetical protein